MGEITIDKRSLETRAIEIIRERILRGEIRAGDKIMENDLAKDLGLSRGTVRSVLQRLSTEELIVQVPYSGWRVPELSEHDAWELKTVRSALEGLAAKTAAQNLTDAGRAKLKESYDHLLACCAEADLPKIAEADLNLHRTIMTISGNSRLLRYFTMVEHQIRLLIAQSNAGWSGPPEDIGIGHADLVDAILAGDADRAEALGKAV